jgi:hypothetical protein
MKMTRKNLKNANRKSKKLRHSKRAIGGFNWKFWEKKPETITDVNRPNAVPEEIKPTCPPCPICDSVVHLPPPTPAPLPMPPSLTEPAPPLQPPQAQLGGKKRQKRKSKKNKRSWFQIGCIKK